MSQWWILGPTLATGCTAILKPAFRRRKVSQGIRTGTVWVNSYGVLDMNVGFGGCKESGYGWKGTPEHVDSFLY
jgi:acyl-CoA reductase-like NAD-dependent aldehyde dehydrogenase